MKNRWATVSHVVAFAQTSRAVSYFQQSSNVSLVCVARAEMKGVGCVCCIRQRRRRVGPGVQFPEADCRDAARGHHRHARRRPSLLRQDRPGHWHRSVTVQHHQWHRNGGVKGFTHPRHAQWRIWRGREGPCPPSPRQPSVWYAAVTVMEVISPVRAPGL